MLAAFVAVTVAGGLLALSRSPLFDVREIDVIGVAHLSADRVRELAGVDRGAGLLWLDLDQVEARVEEDPWVARSTVERVLPSTLAISIAERVPVAVVRTSDGEQLVAADGMLLGRPRGRVELPRLVLPPTQLSRADAVVAVASLALVARWLPADVRGSVETVGMRGDGSVVLTMAGGPSVRFGALEDLRAKGLALREVLSWMRRRGVDVTEISLVSPGAPAVSLSS